MLALISDEKDFPRELRERAHSHAASFESSNIADESKVVLENRLNAFSSKNARRNNEKIRDKLNYFFEFATTRFIFFIYKINILF